MKKTFLSLVLMTTLCIAVSGQIPKHFDLFGAEAMETIQATPEQKKQVANMVKEFRQKTKEVKDDTALSEDEKKVQIRKLNAERGKRFWEILTKEQAEVLKAKQKEKFEERQKALKANQ